MIHFFPFSLFCVYVCVWVWSTAGGSAGTLWSLFAQKKKPRPAAVRLSFVVAWASNQTKERGSRKSSRDVEQGGAGGVSISVTGPIKDVLFSQIGGREEFQYSFWDWIVYSLFSPSILIA